MFKNNLTVSEVEEGSVAEKCGIEKGDIIYACNNNRVYYDLDFAFYEQVKRLELELFRKGRVLRKTIKKGKYEPLGLFFDIPIKTCKNKCIFCFVDQMPENLRKTLYIKDEDLRQSFLNGSYITLSELDYDDVRYIKRFKIYPIFISVHATDQNVRDFILGKKEKIPLMEKLKWLKREKITFHGQIVLVSGINDGSCLKKSINELFNLYPYMGSLSVVPAGLTKYRQGLYKIRDFSANEVKNVKYLVSMCQGIFLKKKGTRFVYLADEFFLMGGNRIPGRKYYEEFSQLENGVGMIRTFTDEFNIKIYNVLKKNYALKKNCRRTCLVTGTGFHKVLVKLINKWNSKYNDDIDVIPVINRLFGEKVNVAGLLAFKDILDQTETEKYSIILIPHIILNNEYLTLDNFMKSNIEKSYRKIRFIDSEAGALISFLKNRLRRP